MTTPRRTWRGWAVILAVSSVVCSSSDVRRAHDEILAIREKLGPGMREDEIGAIFKSARPRHLRFTGVAWKAIRIDQAVPEGAAKEWVLWVSLCEGRAAAVRIRTKDSELERPNDAPADIIWGPEDDGTPFNKPFSEGATDGCRAVIGSIMLHDDGLNTYAYVGSEPISSIDPSGMTRRSPKRASDCPPEVYYYRARYYDPKIRRFLSEDPIGFNGGVNFYVYVGDNPERDVDPDGPFPRNPRASDFIHCLHDPRHLLHEVRSPAGPTPPDTVSGGP